MKEKLRHPMVLLGLLIATLGLGYSFIAVSNTYGFEFLDTMWSGNEVLNAVLQMTQEQKHMHKLATITLDVAFPIAYSALFAGMTLRYFAGSSFMEFLLLPAILVLPIDLIEGGVQMLLLNEQWTPMLSWKHVLTLVKFILFFLALGIALVGWVRAVLERVLSFRKANGA